ETLLTLTIIALFISLSAPLLMTTFEKQSEKQFLTLFEQDILYLQNESFGRNSYNRIIFREDYYTIMHDQDVERTIVRHYPEHLTISSNNTNIISFSRTGTIVNPGTISFQSKHKKNKIVFPFGKGRFYVTE